MLAGFVMAVGSILLMWIGEIITEKGVGNGISLLIFAGIISQLPTTLATLLASITDVKTYGVLNVFGWFTLPINPVVAGIGAIMISVYSC